jgi:thiosulfate dehydrogenase (quinone) large subunit
MISRSVRGRRESDRATSRLVPGWPIALFRIAFGILYLDMAIQKSPWKGYGWLEGFIKKEIAHPAFGWYAAWLRDVVLPNFELFGFLTFVTELALGIALVTGTFTRLAAAAGFLWQVNIALGAFNVPGEWYWIWPLLTLPLFTFAACRAGRVWGVDAILRGRLARRRAGGGRFLDLAT